MGVLAKALSLRGVQWALFRGIAWKTGFNFDLVGKLTHLQADPSMGRLTTTIKLNGEENPIFIEELRYAIEDKKLIIQSVRSDREWLNGLASMTLPLIFEPGDAVIKALSLIK